jgi:hypothetical protein
MKVFMRLFMVMFANFHEVSVSAKLGTKVEKRIVRCLSLYARALFLHRMLHTRPEISLPGRVPSTRLTDVSEKLPHVHGETSYFMELRRVERYTQVSERRCLAFRKPCCL